MKFLVPLSVACTLAAAAPVKRDSPVPHVHDIVEGAQAQVHAVVNTAASAVGPGITNPDILKRDSPATHVHDVVQGAQEQVHDVVGDAQDAVDLGIAKRDSPATHVHDAVQGAQEQVHDVAGDAQGALEPPAESKQRRDNPLGSSPGLPSGLSDTVKGATDALNLKDTAEAAQDQLKNNPGEPLPELPNDLGDTVKGATDAVGNTVGRVGLLDGAKVGGILGQAVEHLGHVDASKDIVTSRDQLKDTPLGSSPELPSGLRDTVKGATDAIGGTLGTTGSVGDFLDALTGHVGNPSSKRDDTAETLPRLPDGLENALKELPIIGDLLLSLLKGTKGVDSDGISKQAIARLAEKAGVDVSVVESLISSQLNTPLQN
ncbi:hypothetical protein FQN54_009270 [Arachnomyces sp. PD_36]|nr:hypothetical protein FQN54_009270 [Arachnomyces sp. PD_36]